jgi:hypothetical protein
MTKYPVTKFVRLWGCCRQITAKLASSAPSPPAPLSRRGEGGHDLLSLVKLLGTEPSQIFDMRRGGL